MVGETTKSATGVLSVEERRTGRVWIASVRFGDGQRAGRTLGLAWAKPNGTTSRGSARWRAPGGSKPSPGYLTPKEAEAALAELLASLPPPADRLLDMCEPLDEHPRGRSAARCGVQSHRPAARTCRPRRRSRELSRPVEKWTTSRSKGGPSRGLKVGDQEVNCAPVSLVAGVAPRRAVAERPRRALRWREGSVSGWRRSCRSRSLRRALSPLRARVSAW
jgi:hypothetical protein